jgi:hypothetical protein
MTIKEAERADDLTAYRVAAITMTALDANIATEKAA